MYRYPRFKSPRNRVRRASGFVLTRHSSIGAANRPQFALWKSARPFARNPAATFVNRAGRDAGDLSNRIQQRGIDAYRTRRAVLLIEISKAMGH
jgi:hypothetical protein